MRIARPLVCAALIVGATSCGDGSTSPGTVRVEIVPNLVTVLAGGSQIFTVSIDGTEDTAVIWSATGGEIVGSGTTVTWQAPIEAGDYSITATSGASPDASASASVTIDPIEVEIGPEAATVATEGTREFTATVAGAAETGVTWDSTCGTIDGDGATIVFTAPAEPTECEVTATSVLDPDASATVAVTVALVDVTLDFTSTDRYTGESFDVTATVTGTTETQVQWDATCGMLQGTGNTVTYTAPDSAGECVITATSVLDPSRSASGTVQVDLPVFVVNTTNDVDDGGCDATHCSLREAISVANAASHQVDGTTVLLDGLSNGSQILLNSALAAPRGRMSIVGPDGATVIIHANPSPASPRRIFRVSGGARLTVENLTLRGGNVVDDEFEGAPVGGGGILVHGESQLVLRNVTLLGHSADGRGGGLDILRDASASLENVTVRDNTAGEGGGGIAVREGGTLLYDRGTVTLNAAGGGRGGGILASEGAVVTLREMTVSDNTSASGGGGLALVDGADGTLEGVTMSGNTAAGPGGGLSVAGSTVELVNSTISGNEVGDGAGGGLYAEGSSADLLNVTIAWNLVPATDEGAGLYSSDGGARLHNVLLANNSAGATAASCGYGSPDPALVESLGHNLSDDDTCSGSFDPGGLSDLINAAAELGPLNDSGGPTLTHSLLHGSDAVDAGDPDACPDFDQRGVARVSTCDIGAVEQSAMVG